LEWATRSIVRFKDQEIQARVVFDMVYDPVETHLLQVARAKGIAVIPGVEMFVQQAAASLRSGPANPLLPEICCARSPSLLQDRAAAQKQPKA